MLEFVISSLRKSFLKKIFYFFLILIFFYQFFQLIKLKDSLEIINFNQKALLRETASGKDIKNLSKPNGKARKMQILQFENLKNIHTIFEINKIPYFIEAGTLLGAIRHKGWIPWDDDTDLGVFYPDCEKADALLDKYNIKRTKVNQIDVSCNFLIQSDKKKEIIKVHKMMKFLGRFRKIPILRNISSYSFKYFIKKYTSDKSNLIAAHHYLDGRLNDPYFENGIYENMMFPLKKVTFEGFEFWAPNDPDKFLIQVYGNWDEVGKSFGIFDHNHGIHEKPTTYHKYTHQELDEMILEAKKLGETLKKEKALIK